MTRNNNKNFEKDTRKIAIYSRKSKFTGKGDSVENQIELCKKKIQYHFDNIDLENDILIYEDEGFTGANTKRPSFQRMLSDIRENKIKTIAFYRLDRISRNVHDFSTLLNELNNYNVSILSATENLETLTPSGKAMVLMTSVFSQLERDTIAERIRDNMLELAKTGRWLGGTTPTGFKSEAIEKISLDGKKRKLFKLTPIEDEMKNVKTIYNKYLEIKSQTGLETYLLQHNIKTKNGCDYTRWGLVNILTNPVYAIADNDIYNYYKGFNIDIFADESAFNGEYGVMAYNKTEKKGSKGVVERRDIDEWIISIGKHKGIISGNEWVEVQTLLNKNADMRYRKPNQNNALLSGLLRCSHCGSFMRPKLKGSNSFDENGKRRFDYMCELKDKSRKVKCDCKNINGLEADSLVMQTIKELTNPSSKFYQELKKLSLNVDSKDNKNLEEIKTLKSTLKKNENDIATLLDRIKIVDVLLLEDLTNEIKKLKNANVEIEKQIKNLESNDNTRITDKETADIVLNILNSYHDTFDTLDLITKRNLIKLLISSAYSDGEDLTLNMLGARSLEDENIIPTGGKSK